MEYQFESIGPLLRFVSLGFLFLFGIGSLALIVGLAALPGQVAKRKRHPQFAAINLCGWLGMPTGVLWVVAMVWANWNTNSQIVVDQLTPELQSRLDRIEAMLTELETQASGAKA